MEKEQLKFYETPAIIAIELEYESVLCSSINELNEENDINW